MIIDQDRLQATGGASYVQPESEGQELQISHYVHAV